MQKKEKEKSNLEVLLSKDLDFEYSVAKDVITGIRRIVAPNPSPYTLHGTGSYIVGNKEVVVIDPVPNIQSHINAILRATEKEKITHIIVTHTHLDHSPAAFPLSKETGAVVMGYGPHGNSGGGEEGADYSFNPQHKLIDGEVIKGKNWELECIYTPGHTSNHICYADKRTGGVFTGDHVMGWSTTLVSPPDGDMGDYFKSLKKMLLRDDKFYIPAHGSIIKNPQKFVKALIGHRKMRERQIEKLLGDQAQLPISKLVEKMYPQLDRRLIGAAGRSVLAHLLHMENMGMVSSYEEDNGKKWHLQGKA